MILRIEVSEEGQPALPAIDIDDASPIVIGSSPTAAVRLPAAVARPEHARIVGGRWSIAGPADGGDGGDGGNGGDGGDGGNRDDGDGGNGGTGGDIGEGAVLAIGNYRVRIAPAPPGTSATPPQRTESLARELLRSLMGADAAPSLEVERGPVVGAKRVLPPPPSTLVIGRGDEANWILLDEDLSRMHAEVRRDWDGMRIVDLGSKNGTRVDGTLAASRDDTPTLLRDGALVELGKVALRFRDPAEKHLSASPVLAGASSASPASASPSGSPASSTAVASPSAIRTTKQPSPSSSLSPSSAASTTGSPESSRARASTLPFYAALAIMLVALCGLVWILSA